MPYKLEGNTIMHKKGGKWSKKQTATSKANAKSALRLLYGVEHGWKPTRNSTRGSKPMSPKEMMQGYRRHAC